jgi:hypothetical protein
MQGVQKEVMFNMTHIQTDSEASNDYKGVNHVKISLHD